MLTTQLFTNKAFDDKVYAGPPYSADEGRDTSNDSDGIYSQSGEMTLSMRGDDVRGVITRDVQAA